MSGGGGGDYTAGYWYYMDLLLVFCQGPVDEVVEIRAGDRVAWSGSVTSNQAIEIRKSGLFGGEEREGGLSGDVQVLMGGTSQTAPADLVDSLTAAGIVGSTPAYRGLLSMFFGKGSTNQPGFAFSAMNPYFKPIKALLRSYNRSGWYLAKARIGNDANPAHIIYECWTRIMGYSPGLIDDTRMRAVADTLYTEGFGISLVWRQQSTIEAFAEEVLRHINGAPNQDRETGRLFIKLIRDDYDTGSLPVFDPDNCDLESFSRAGAAEIVNEITLKFTRAEEGGKQDAVTVQNLASIRNQGRVIPQELDYFGITDATLAARVAQRELETRSRGLAKATIIATREAFAVYLGDAVKLTWPDLGIASLIMRVVSMNIGDLESGTIRIELIEDNFGLPATSFVEAPPIGWTDNSGTAVPVVDQRAIEAPYWTVFRRTTSADRADYPADWGFGMVFARNPMSSSVRYQLMASPDGSAYSNIGVGNWTPYCALASGVDRLTTTWTINTMTSFYTVEVGDLAYVGDEIVEITAIGSGTVTVTRGVLDTIPEPHDAGADVFIEIDGQAGYDNEVRVDGETVYYKSLTVASQETLAVGLASPMTLTLDNRASRPYPPGNVQIGGEYWPATVADEDVAVTWAHRDRTQQTATPHIAWTAGNVGPEAGVTYTLRVYRGVTLLETQSGISGTSATIFSVPTTAGAHRIELESVRGGLASRMFVHAFEV